MGSPKRHSDTFSQPVDQQHPQFVNAVARAFSILRCFEDGAHVSGQPGHRPPDRPAQGHRLAPDLYPLGHWAT